jgi:outer membrane biosynthesis protein TonB
MAAPLIKITGIGPAAANTLMDHGFKTVESIADTAVEELSAVPGFSVIRAQKTIDAAKQLLASTSSDSATATPVKKPAVKKQASKKTVKKTPAPKDKKSKDKKSKDKDKKSKDKDKKSKKDKKDKGKKKKNKSKNKKK